MIGVIVIVGSNFIPRRDKWRLKLICCFLGVIVVIKTRLSEAIPLHESPSFLL